MRRRTRRAPLMDEVRAEAIEFRRESEALRGDLAQLRTEIASTMAELEEFGSVLKEQRDE